MYPEIELFNKTISTYGVMMLVGIIAVVIYLKLKLKGKNDYPYIITLIWGAVGAIIGSHLLYALTKLPLLVPILKHPEIINSFDMFKSVFGLVFGGSVFYGGLIGGLIGGFLYLNKFRKAEKKEIIYLLTPAIPLFHGFARIGCFLVGCCYGIESHLGFVYKNGIVEQANHVNRFPVQLVESLCDFILFIVLNYFVNKVKLKDKLLYVYLISYAVIRFGLEFLRDDSYRGFVGPLSTSQIISILLIAFSVVSIIKQRKK